MPETEQIILSKFLLSPAPFPSIISLEKFTDLFPTSQRSNPQVEHLYRELQGLRSLYIEDVKRSISREVKRGERQRHQVVKTRRQGAYVESEPVEGRAKGAQIEVRASRSRSFEFVIEQNLAT